MTNLRGAPDSQETVSQTFVLPRVTHSLQTLTLLKAHSSISDTSGAFRSCEMVSQDATGSSVETYTVTHVRRTILECSSD